MTILRKYQACLLAGVATVALAPHATAQVAATTGQTADLKAPVSGQDAAAASPAAPQDPSGTALSGAQEAPTSAGDGKDVVVTGSRLVQNGNSMPTPTTIVATQQLLVTTPTNLIDGLQTLPVFAGSTGPAGSNGRPTSNSSARTLNLRNLGPSRNLVLFDSVRVAPTSADGIVDLDFVPSLLLARVDVVTGGASAVYGSDAVTGVINFITDRRFNGFKAEALSGISSRGDAGQQRIGVAGGTSLFGDRLHVEGSYEFYNNPGILTKLTRGFGRDVWTVAGAGTTANPLRLVKNSRSNLWTVGGLISNGPLAGQNFTQDGMLSAFQHGTRTGTPSLESGGDGYFFESASLVASTRSHQVFGRVDYDASDDIHLFAEGIGAFKRNQNGFGPGIACFTGNCVISNANPFLPASVRAQLPANGNFSLGKVFQQADDDGPITDTSSYLANVGADGEIGGWKWNVGFIRSYSDAYTHQSTNWNNDRLAAALDAVVNPANGQIVCYVTLASPGSFPGCLPLNPFGPTSSNPAALSWIQGTTAFHAKNEQNDVIGGVAGSPFSLWGGPVQVALSAEGRRSSLKIRSNNQPSTQSGCTTIRFNCSSPRWGGGTVADATARQTVKEGAVEVEIPLIKDLSIVKALSLNGGARYTDYSTSGGVWTWKVGGVLDLGDQITLRATRSRDIRAPNLFELFGPVSPASAGATDLHTGLAGAALTETRGNADLVPEVAQTWTAGVVVRPSFLPRFSIAVDYYNIKIANAIISVNGLTTATQATCEASGGTAPVCALIIRPLPFSDRSAANFPTRFLSSPVNAQTLKTEGFDVDANYRLPLLGGNLSLRTLVTYQPHLYQTQYTGAPTLDLADVPPVPKTRVTVFAGYDIGKLRLNLQERYQSGTQYNSLRTLIFAEPRLPSASYTDVTGTVEVTKGAQLYFTVQNLFDRQPSPYGASVTSTPGLATGFAPGQDVIGRYMIVGFRLRG